MRALPLRWLGVVGFACGFGLLASIWSCGAATPTPSAAITSSESSISSVPPVAPSDSSAPSVTTSSAPSPSASVAKRSDLELCADAALGTEARTSACHRACEYETNTCVTEGDVYAAAGGEDAEERAAGAWDRGCTWQSKVACARLHASLERLKGACAAKTPKPCTRHAKLVLRLDSVSDDDRKGADASAKVACDANDVDACEARGELHDAWEPDEKHKPQAFAAFTRACDLGRGAACCRVALFVETGVGTKGDAKRAEALRTRAKKSGDPGCQSASERMETMALAVLETTDGSPTLNVLRSADPPNAPKPAPTTSATAAPTGPAITLCEPTTSAPNLPGADAIVAKNKWRFRGCYTKALAVDPNAAGTVKVTVAVQAEGRVTSASATGGSPPQLASCIAQSFYAMTFPPPGAGSASFGVSIRLEAKK